MPMIFTCTIVRNRQNVTSAGLPAHQEGNITSNGREPIGRRVPCCTRRSASSPQARESDLNSKAGSKIFRKLVDATRFERASRSFGDRGSTELSYAPTDGGASGISIPALPVLKTGVLSQLDDSPAAGLG